MDHQTYENKPSFKRYPNKISVSGDIWDAVLRLYKFTSQFNYEHSISFFDCDGDIVATPPVKGSKTQVTTRHMVSFRYEYKVNDLYEKQISIDGKLVKKIAVRQGKIPKKPAVHQLFNFHSHPSTEAGDVLKYSFFSGTDVTTLLKNPALCMGLVTDELLIACKHDQATNIFTSQFDEALHAINIGYYHNKGIDTNFLNKIPIVVYRAKFKKKLERVN